MNNKAPCHHTNDPAANDGDELSDMKVRAEEKGFTFPYLQDVGQQSIFTCFCIAKRWDRQLYIGIDDSYRSPKKVKKRYVEQAVDAKTWESQHK